MKTFLLALVAVPVVALIIFCGYQNTTQPEVATRPQAAMQAALPDDDTVFYEAQDWIRDHLKSPSTAKFSTLHWDSDTNCKWLKKNRFAAMGFVDAQNSYGAMLREKWFVVIEETTTNYFIHYWELGDQIAGKMPTN